MTRGLACLFLAALLLPAAVSQAQEAGKALDPDRSLRLHPGAAQEPGVRAVSWRIGADSAVVFQATPPLAPLPAREIAASKTAGWIPILQEDFEQVESFLGTWTRFRLQPSADVFWFTTDLKALSGSRSAWGSGDGLDATVALGRYPDNTHSWLQYGPFDLTGVSKAQLSFFRSVETATSADELFWGVSTDGVNFTGFGASGNEPTWREDGLNLSAYVGQAQVWIAFVFRSNIDGQNGPGVFVDDVLLEKNDDPFPPATPTLLSPSDGAVNVAPATTLVWNDVPQTVSYSIQVSTSSDFSTTVLDRSGLTQSSFAPEGLLRATTYYWRVRAVNVGGASPWSGVFRFTTIPQPPAAPALLSPATGTLNVPRPVVLDWSDVSGAASYHVQLSTSNGFVSTVVDQPGLIASAHSAQGLNGGTRYYWRARAANAWEPGPWSETRSFTTIPDPPPAPVLVDPPPSATFLPPNLTLDWTDVPRATAYRGQVSASESFATILFDTGDQALSQLSLNGLSDSTIYYWRARAANVAGTSPWSAVSSFLTAWPDTANAPSPSLASPPTDAVNQAVSLSLVWNAVPGSTVRYDAQLATDAAFAGLVLDRTDLVGAQTEVSGLSLNSGYYWRVRARVDTLVSPWSVVRTFSTLPPAPTAPALVSPPAGAVDVSIPVTLTWGTEVAATAYDLQVSTSAAFSPLLVDETALVLPSYTLSNLAPGGTHYWRVRSVGFGGTSGWSTARSFTTLPNPPGVPSPISPADAAANLPRPVTLDWSDAPGATSYEVQIATENTFSSPILSQTGLPSSVYTAGSLAAGTTYYWRARARNSGGAGAWTAPRSFGTLPDAPGTPTLVAPANGAVDRPIPVTLDWSNVTGATSYQAQVSTRSDFATTVLDVPGISFSLFAASGLNAGTTYYWRVRAVNAGGAGPWSPVWSFATLPALPAAPALVSPANAATNLLSPIVLDWSDVTGATGYRVQVAATSSFSPTLVNQAGLTASSYPFETTARGTTFYWRARAANAGGEGPWSTTRSFATMPPPPTAPGPLAPANGAVNVPRPVLLDWSDVGTSPTYQIQLHTIGDFSAPLLDQSGLTASAFTASSLAAGTAYYWRVRVTTVAGTSPWSGTSSFVTLPDPPSAPTLGTPQNGVVNVVQPLRLAWSVVSAAATYSVQVAATADFAGPAINQTGISAAYLDVQGLARGKTFYWRVRGVNAAGPGPWSAAFRFTTIPEPPPAPTLVTPAAGAANLAIPVAFDWADSPGATSYRIQVSPVEAFWMTTVDQAGLATSAYSGTTLLPGELYYWRVSATNVGGTGAWSEVRTLSTLPEIPQPPALVSPGVQASDVALPVVFDWTDVTGATGYRIQISATADFVANVVDQNGLTASAYTATSLAGGQTYYWRVRATNIAGASLWSDVRSFSTLASIPAAPTLVEPASGSADRPTALTLDWSDVPGAASYQAQVSTSQSFNPLSADSGSLSTSQFSVSGLSFSATYYWRARAANGAGVGPWSEVRSFTTVSQSALPAPGLASPPDGSTDLPTTVTLAWNAVAGTGIVYDVQVAANASFSPLAWESSGQTGTLADLSNLARNTTHYWRVRARDATRTGAWSDMRRFTTLPPPPPPPTLTSPAGGATDQAQPVPLDWNDVPGATSYDAQVAANPGFAPIATEQTGLLVSSLLLPVLQPGSTYYWRVRSTGPGGTGDWSVSRSFTTRPSPPDAPLLLAPADGAANLIPPLALDWSDVSGAATYELQVSTTQTFSTLQVSQTGLTASASTVASLPPGTVFYWRARAVNSGGSGPWSATRVFGTRPEPPSVAPDLLGPADAATNLAIPVTLDWSNVATATTYQLQVSTRIDFGPSDIEASDLVFSVYEAIGLGRGTTYYWRARAANAAGSGPWSAVRSFTTLPLPPAAPTPVSPAQGATNLASPVLLDWTDAESAASYRVQVATSQAFSPVLTDLAGLTGSSYPFETSARSTTFFWRVRATNAGGESGWSETRSFTTLPPPPAAPELVAPPTGTKDLARPVSLDWTDVGASTSYRVQVSVFPDFSVLALDQSGIVASTVILTTLDPGRSYAWRVRAVGAGGEGPWSTTGSFSTVPDPPGAPQPVSPEAGAPRQPLIVTLDWADTPGAAAYEAQLATSPDFTSAASYSNLSVSQVVVAGLSPATGYAWRVRASNAGGTGPWSEVRSFSTASPEALPHPALLSPANGAIDQPVPAVLQWNSAGAGALTYEVQVAESNAFQPLAAQVSGVAATQSSVSGLVAGVRYFWRVRAASDAQTSDWSPVWQFTTAPPPPAAPLALSPAAGATRVSIPVAFEWNALPGATGYRLQVSSARDFSSTAFDRSALAEPRFSVEGLEPGAFYYWHVRAGNAGGDGPWSEVRSFGTIPLPPGAPSLISPVDGTSGLIPPLSLDWSDVAGSDAYEIQVATSPDFVAVIAGSSGVATSAFALAEAPAGATIYWRARAANAGGNGPWSAVRRFTTAPAPPVAPTLLSPPDDAGAVSLPVSLDWADVVGATGYQVQVSADAGFGAVLVDETGLSLSSLTARTLARGTAYFWRARASNAGGLSPWSAVRSFSTAPAAPDAPALLAPSDGAVDLAPPIALDWTDAPDATSYRVQISPTADFADLVVDRLGVSVSSLSEESLSGGARWFWRVQAVNAGGAGPWSAVRSFTSRPGAPPPPLLATPGDGATDVPLFPTLDWLDVAGATGYEATVSLDANFDEVVADTANLVHSQFAPPGLAEDTGYFWRARAVNAGGLGAWSPTWSFRTVSSAALAVPSPFLPPNQASGQPATLLLSWSAVGGEGVRYQVQLSRDPSFGVPEVDETGLSQTTFEASGLVEGVSYSWRVRATDGARTTGWSAVWQFTTLSGSPAAPRPISPDDGASNVIPPVVLEWSAVDLALSYQTQVSTVADFATTLVDQGELTLPTFLLETPAPGQTLFWRSRARNAAGAGPWSEIRRFTTRPTPPTAPALESPADGASGLEQPVRLVWSEPEGDVVYRVQLASSPDFSTALVDVKDLTAATFLVGGLAPATTYSWRVRASNGGGPGPWSAARTFSTAPGPPGVPVPLAPPGGSVDLEAPVRLSWAPVAGAVTYRTQLAADPGFGSLERELTTETLAVEASDLADGTRFYWRVRSENESGTSPWSNVRSFVTLPPVPGAPELVSPSEGAVDQPPVVTLDWRDTFGATHYHVQLAPVANFASLLVDATEVESSQLSTPNLSTQGPFYWRVRAVGSRGEGPWSSARSFTGIAPGGVAAPALSAPANGAIDRLPSLTLQWLPAGSGTIAYEVEVSPSADFVAPAFSAPSVPSLVVEASGLERGSTYFWRVRGRDGDRIGPWSIVWTFSTLPNVPAAPVATAPDDGLGGLPTDLTLFWIAGSDASSYRIQVSTSADFASGLLVDEGRLVSPSFTLSAIGRGTTYYWRVGGINAGGQGPWSEVRRFTTTLAPPRAPQPQSPAGGSVAVPLPVTLRWEAIAEAETYTLQVGVDEACSATIVHVVGLTSPEFVVEGLSFDTVYFWRVQGQNAVGSGPWSPAWNFRTAGSSVDSEEDAPSPPTETRLLPNYPNPFNPATTVTVELATASRVSVTVYDVLGRPVTRLIDDRLSPGVHRLVWRADGIASGTYLCVLRAGDTVEVRKMVLVR